MQNSFSVLTIFPEFIEAFFNCGIIKRAVSSEKIKAKAINIRDFTKDKHKNVDDKPYGGGAGMLMMAEPIISAIKHTKKKVGVAKTILLSPSGKLFDNKMAKNLSKEKNLIFVCGRYEGVDERVLQFVDKEISIGDFVMTGGEVAAIAIIDSIIRFIPNILGNELSSIKDSFEENLLEHSQYTRPPILKKEKVPDVLISGDHKKIEEWRIDNSLKKTFLKRSDLFEKRIFSKEEKEILKKWLVTIEKIIKQ